MIRFHNPELLVLLGIVPILIYRYVHRERQKRGSIRFSGIGTFRQQARSSGNGYFNRGS